MQSRKMAKFILYEFLKSDYLYCPMSEKKSEPYINAYSTLSADFAFSAIPPRTIFLYRGQTRWTSAMRKLISAAIRGVQSFPPRTKS